MNWRIAHIPRSMLNNGIVIPGLTVQDPAQDPGIDFAESHIRSQLGAALASALPNDSHIHAQLSSALSSMAHDARNVSRPGAPLPPPPAPQDRDQVSISPLLAEVVPRVNQLYNLAPHQLIRVYYIGEPMERFRGMKLIEIPTPLLTPVMVEMNHFCTLPPPLDNATLNVLMICYGRRLFVASMPILDEEDGPGHPARCLVGPGDNIRLHLPRLSYFGVQHTPVEDPLVGTFFLDPVVFLGVGEGQIDGPFVEAIEPKWEGFLVFEGNSKSLVVRASGTRINIESQRNIKNVQLLPKQIRFKANERIRSSVLMEKVSQPHAEWLGLFVTKDELGCRSRAPVLRQLQEKMVVKKFGYAIPCKGDRPGTLYVWSMRVNRDSEAIHNFVFSFVPDLSRTPPFLPAVDERALEANPRWRGVIAMGSSEPNEWPVAAIDWILPNSRGMEEFEWPNVLVCEDSNQITVGAFMQMLEVRSVTWGVRFMSNAPSDNWLAEVMLKTLAGFLVEHDVCHKLRIDRGNTHAGDLMIFGSPLDPVGVALVAVYIDYLEE